MQIFGKYLQESEDRSAIFIRYGSIPLLEQWQDYLNTDTHRCVIIKKNASAFVFIISSSNVTLELYTTYDDERYCFMAFDCKLIDSLECSSINIDKVDHLDRNFGLAIKPEGWKYKNSQCISTTMNLYDEISVLTNYDVVMEELRRQEEIRLREEEENKNAEKQLDVWTKYVKKERELLDDANKPFALSESFPDIKKSLVDIETLPHITSFADSEMLNEISEIIGGAVVDNTLEQNLEEFAKWQEKGEEVLDAQITGLITMRMSVKCDGHWDAKEFKEEHKYGREFYFGWYDSDTSSIDLTFKTSDITKLFEFYERVNNSFHFRGTVSLTDVKVSFSLKVTTTESEDERKKRIDILSGRDMYSKPNMQGVYLGTLSKNGSDKKHLRILLPKDKEERQAAKEFFKEKSTTLIYPGLLKDKVLLNREFDALNKLSSPQKLQNQLLKEFIFNSSRAQATEDFVGLNSDSLAITSQYIDCQRTQMLSLNASQQEAVVKGLYAKDLCLLQGPPGTGKTTVISELIWQHIRKNQSIRLMLTSQTNLAIDNALNRLFSNSAVIEGSTAWRNLMLIKPIRKAGIGDRIEPEGRPFSNERIENWIAGIDESESTNNVVHRWMNHIAQRVPNNDTYKDVLSEWKSALYDPMISMRKTFADQYKKDSNVLCMTCGMVDSSDFNAYEAGQGFDVVIVDEASKATLPELLMPLCYARKSIVIGDHRQLPPVIFEDDFFKKIREIDPELEAELDKQFKHDLVEESLFKRLIMHPNLSDTIRATFKVQYRMHPEINNVIAQFYASDGGLQCGLDKTKVDNPDFSEKDSRYHGMSLGKFIQPNIHTIWVDVPDGMEQGGEGSSTFNEKEVDAISLVIEALTKSEGFNRYMEFWSKFANAETRITESKIGVISFYAAQVQKIRSSIQSFCDRHDIKVTTKSVDKFQGQESGIVIVSTVRTKKLGFTRTPERLNVALSRAKRLLIIVGNSGFYSSDKAKTDEGQYIYRNVIEHIRHSNNASFIDYRELRTLLGYSYEQ